jgi:hypothetical protein
MPVRKEWAKEEINPVRKGNTAAPVLAQNSSPARDTYKKKKMRNEKNK